ncbi:hypothetical protein AKJ47_02875 [candidate division MSBL1 archaeon SCGC-AAA261G05]|uniref:Uncharacterized protein n=2 Tax=candidate division MSBL1 TaxID=215777 RepID=A0A133V0S6_9EURY|nr:hypothetical protein AKJ42_01825 [candidate division MSBL1 archaeon SCGC-AAA261C02]KXB03082.1 hypothetical protein AKJ47_02875 [candidate division MSBL1 archaeon SCGC-AAA261G05]
MVLYAGIDVHKKTCHGVITDAYGKILKNGTFDNSDYGIQNFFDGYGDVEAVIEASYSWRPTYERLDEIGIDVKLAHPYKVRAIAEARIKTDKIDAGILAHLLRANLIPESYVPPKETRELRDKVRLRTQLMREKVRLENKIYAELEKNRIDLDENPFTKKGKEDLRELGIGSVDRYLVIHETVEEQMKVVSNELKEIADDSEEAELLMTIPGVGYFSALLFISEIGDIDRFSSPKKLCSYFGIVPSVHKSGKTEKYGRITKQGSGLVRWALTQCVWSHVRWADSQLTRFYLRKRREKGKKTAAVATARKLLTVIYYMLKKREKFRLEG